MQQSRKDGSLVHLEKVIQVRQVELLLPLQHNNRSVRRPRQTQKTNQTPIWSPWYAL